MHHWKPNDYFDMTPGQRKVVKEFLKQEVKDINDEMSRLGKG